MTALQTFKLDQNQGTKEFRSQLTFSQLNCGDDADAVEVLKNDIQTSVACRVRRPAESVSVVEICGSIVILISVTSLSETAAESLKTDVTTNTSVIFGPRVGSQVSRVTTSVEDLTLRDTNDEQSSNDNDDSVKLSTETIVGIVAAAIVGCLLFFSVIYYCCCCKRKIQRDPITGVTIGNVAISQISKPKVERTGSLAQYEGAKEDQTKT